MSADRVARRFAEIAQKWRGLIDRRCAHLVELQRSGEWRYHYNEAEFLELMREAIALKQTWRELAPDPEDGGAADASPDVGVGVGLGVAQSARRAAA